MWQVRLAFVRVAKQYCIQLVRPLAEPNRFVQPNPGRLLCPIVSCDHRFTQAKTLYKHCRQKSNALHKRLAVALGARSREICHKDLKRWYDWERHMIKRHKRPSPLLEGCFLLDSTPQFTELQLRQKNSEVDPTVPDPRPSKGQTTLLLDNQCQDDNHIASPHQPCRSGVGRPTPWVKARAYSGHTTV